MDTWLVEDTVKVSIFGSNLSTILDSLLYQLRCLSHLKKKTKEQSTGTTNSAKTTKANYPFERLRSMQIMSILKDY